MRAEAEEELYLKDLPVIALPDDGLPQPTEWLCSQQARANSSQVTPQVDGASSSSLPSGSPPGSQFDADPPDPADVFRIMVATDIHLGFLERDPIRGEDSFRTFEEVLRTAKEAKVDFLLLGGDLFHHSKPSQAAIFKTLELLRKYCLGDDEVQMELLSDQTVNFPTNAAVNYEDPNFNVSLPIFTIHGNHDDPSGEEGLACIDLLSVANMINHFGRSSSAERVEVYPVLLRKGATRLALYGIGHIRDQRLHRVFVQGNVHFHRPCENTDQWFNLMVLHQNRVAHSAKNCIHDQLIPRWMDMIFWGHEHECLITPTKSAVQDFAITQPGSSVATSLIHGEARPKHIGLLEVCEKSFRLTPIRLTTVRPFIYDALSLADFRTELEPNDVEQIGDFLAAKITEMIALAAESSFEGEAGPSLSAAPMLPLIRLCVNYSGGFQTVHPSRFGQRFVGKVANPDSLLRFTRQSVRNLDRPTLDLEREQEILRDFAQHAGANNGDRQDEQAIGHLIQSFLSSGMRPLQALAVDELTTALTDFVDKGDNAAFSAFLSHTVKATCDHLNGLDPMSTMTEGDITSLIIERTQKLNISGADCHLDGEESDECCRSPPHSPIDPASLAGVSLQEASLQEPASHPQRANPFENRTSNKLPAPKRSSPSRPRGATQSARSKRASSGDGLTNSGPLGDTRVPIKRQRKGTPGLTTTMTPTRLNPAITISLDSDDDDSSSPAPQSSWLPKAASATTKSSTYGSSSIGAEDVTPMVPIPIPGRARNWGIRPVDR